jgi:hypothetical protein
VESITYKCIECHEVKPEDEFYRTPVNKRGRTAACKACLFGRRERWRGEFPTYADKSRDNHLKRKYGINTAQYVAMKAAQGGVCAICGTDDPGRKGEFHVDHCHATGVVRGLLCITCNQALGLLYDSPDLMEAAAAYVRKHAKDKAA